MNKIMLVVLQACLAMWLTSSTANAASLDQPKAVTFFDVSELPARIDAPKISQSDKELVLDCAVANRSNEDLLGLRLVLLVIDPAGKLRGRVTWTEVTELTIFSIKTFAFHPEISGDLRSTDKLFLGIDEVIGRETIWRAVGSERALRAYSRGQHDVVPGVRTFANKYDTPPGMKIMPMIKRN